MAIDENLDFTSISAQRLKEIVADLPDGAIVGPSGIPGHLCWGIPDEDGGIETAGILNLRHEQFEDWREDAEEAAS